MPRFARHFGIDYSGAATPEMGLTGLRVYEAPPDGKPVEKRPADGRHWSRRALAAWLEAELRAGPPTLVAIDHAFGLPLAYVEAHGLAPDWRLVMDDFVRHWPTDQPGARVADLRQMAGARRRAGEARWRRWCDRRARAKSPFHFGVPGSVASSTHAGLPWLAQLCGAVPQLHVWPFDGWQPPEGVSVLAEGYPSLWNREWPCDGRTQDQHDAWTLARVLATADAEGRLEGWFEPMLSTAERAQARVEGWILGLL
jgi:hypothetical protein